VGLYFSAHWCPPCRGFTPKLAEAYTAIVGNGKSFEIVFVSSDYDAEAFVSYYKEMPWLGLPFAERELQQKLSDQFKVSGIPSLILLDVATGEVISKDGCTVVMHDPTGKDFPWRNVRDAFQAEGPQAKLDLEAIFMNAPEPNYGSIMDALVDSLQEPLSDKQKAIATWAFEDCDTDHDGFITKQDIESSVALTEALRTAGTSVDDWIATFDYNGDSQVSLEEWIKFYTVCCACRNGDDGFMLT